MKLCSIIAAGLLACFTYTSAAAAADSDCSVLAGGDIIANDGKYLGKITNQYDSDSIFDEYGDYGSEYQSDSIWNKYGNYGSEYSSASPMNAYAAPARIVKNGTYWNFSVNQGQSILNPKVLKALCSDM